METPKPGVLFHFGRKSALKTQVHCILIKNLHFYKLYTEVNQYINHQ